MYMNYDLLWRMKIFKNFADILQNIKGINSILKIDWTIHRLATTCSSSKLHPQNIPFTFWQPLTTKLITTKLAT